MKIKKEVKIGLFGVLMLILLYWGLSFLKGKDIFKLTNTYYALYDNVNGMEVSSPVVVNGFNVGRVSNIEYTPNAEKPIRIEFTIGSDYELPVGSQAVVTSTGLMGSKVIDILMGDSKTMINDGDTLKAETNPDMLDVASQEIGKITSKLNLALDDLHISLQGVNGVLSENNVKSISLSLKNIETMTNQLSGGELKLIMSDTRKFTKSLSDNSERIDTIIANFENLSDSLKQAQIPTLVASLNSLVTKINDGEGTVGQLVNDKQLYDSLVTVSSNLATLLQDLEQNPKRYVHFSLFGKKDKDKPKKELK